MDENTGFPIPNRFYKSSEGGLYVYKIIIEAVDISGPYKTLIAGASTSCAGRCAF